MIDECSHHHIVDVNISVSEMKKFIFWKGKIMNLWKFITMIAVGVTTLFCSSLAEASPHDAEWTFGNVDFYHTNWMLLHQLEKSICK